MSLRSTPALTNALITACCRSLVWFIAVVTSGAVNSIETLAVSKSGVPCTCPEPTTVTWLLSLLGSCDGPVFDESHADSPTARQAAAKSNGRFSISGTLPVTA